VHMVHYDVGSTIVVQDRDVDRPETALP